MRFKLLFISLFLMNALPAMELPESKEKLSDVERMITLINNDSDTIEIPFSLACKSTTIKNMTQIDGDENSFPVGFLSRAQLHFIKNYLIDLDTTSSSTLESKLAKMSLEQLTAGLKAINFLDIKPKKPLIKALTFCLLSAHERKKYLKKGSCSLDLPEEILERIRKQYAQYDVLNHWLIKAQLLKHNGKLPSTNWKYTPTECLQYNPSGTKIAEVHYNAKSIALQDPTQYEGRRLAQWLSGHTDVITAISWSPCGTKLASAAKDHTIKIWDVNDQKCLASWPIPNAQITQLAWNPNGDSLAWGAPDRNAIFVVNADTGTVINSYDGHEILIHKSIADLKWDDEGRQLASSGIDGYLKIYNSTEPKTSKAIMLGSSARCLAWKPHSNNEIAIGQDNGTVIIKNILYPNSYYGQNKVFDHKISRSSHRQINSVAWHPTQSLIASGTFQDGIKIWNSNSFECQHFLNSKLLSALAWHPDGGQLAVGSFDGTTLWHWYDKELKKELLQTITPEEMVLQCAIACSPETVDICAPQLQKTWETMHPLMQETLTNVFPYRSRLMSWLKNAITPSIQNINIGCNPRMD